MRIIISQVTPLPGQSVTDCKTLAAWAKTAYNAGMGSDFNRSSEMGKTFATRDDLAFALKQYGEVTLTYAKSATAANYDNMCFWQHQVWVVAQEVAEGEKE